MAKIQEDDWLDEDEIIDPNLGMRLQRVNTEFYLGRLAYKASEAGIYKFFSPTARTIYKYAVEQLEIFSIGSGWLKSTYWKQKKELENTFLKKQVKLGEEINPTYKRSRMNMQISQKISDEELTFITEWHKLLMRTLSPLFYTHYKVETL